MHAGTGGTLSHAVSGAGMGLVVDGEQAVAVDLGVDLGRRQGGVAQEFLDLAEIGAGRQEVGCEGVAQRVGRRGLGKAEGVAQAGDCELDDAG